VVGQCRAIRSLKLAPDPAVAIDSSVTRAAGRRGRPRRPHSRYSDGVTTLDAVLERIVAVAKPDRVILFGSAARGTAGPQSDLDFLVIKRGVTSRRQLAQTIYRALVGIRASVDVVVVTPEDVESLRGGVGTIVGPARATPGLRIVADAL